MEKIARNYGHGGSLLSHVLVRDCESEEVFTLPGSLANISFRGDRLVAVNMGSCGPDKGGSDADCV